MLLRNTNSHTEGMYCIETRGGNMKTPKFLDSVQLCLMSTRNFWKMPRNEHYNFSKIAVFNIFSHQNIKSTKKENRSTEGCSKLSKLYSLCSTLLIIYKTEVTATIIWACSWTKNYALLFWRVYMVTYFPYYRDGCTSCDVFCATCNILEYMKVEGTVDVFQTARQLQRHRPEFFKDFVSLELLCIYRVDCHVENMELILNRGCSLLSGTYIHISVLLMRMVNNVVRSSLINTWQKHQGPLDLPFETM